MLFFIIAGSKTVDYDENGLTMGSPGTRNLQNGNRDPR